MRFFTYHLSMYCLRISRIYHGNNSSLHHNRNVRSAKSMRFRVRRPMQFGKFLPKRKTRLDRVNEEGHKRRKDGGSLPPRVHLRLGEILKKIMNQRNEPQ